MPPADALISGGGVAASFAALLQAGRLDRFVPRDDDGTSHIFVSR